MARKVFISFLGANKYSPCSYYHSDEKGDFKSDEMSYIQVATLDYLTSRETWTGDDLALILLTKLSHDKNWMDNGHTDFKTNITIPSLGLESCLCKRNYPMPIKPLENLPDGNNQDEILEIFQCLFEEIHEGDELYFDITHGFRYLPMLVLSLGNYAKFLRGATVKHITYGNFEGRDKATNEAQIMDLMSLSLLQDWTSAAASFIRNGDATQLAKLTKAELSPILRSGDYNDLQSARTLNELVKNLEKVTADMMTCRGLNIENAENISAMKRHLDNLQEVIIRPLKPIIDKVKDEFGDFNNSPDVMNGFHAAKWCIQHGLMQQATTIMQESVVSYFHKVYSHHITCKLLEDRRDIISTALNILADDTPESEWKLRKPEHLPQLKEVVQAFEQDREAYLVQHGDKQEHISTIYRTLATGLRNDINHNGMRNNPLKCTAIKTKTEELYNLIYTCLTAKAQR